MFGRQCECHTDLLGIVDTRTDVEARSLVLIDTSWARRVDLMRIGEVLRVGLCFEEAAENDVSRLNCQRRLVVAERDVVRHSGDTKDANKLRT